MKKVLAFMLIAVAVLGSCSLFDLEKGGSLQLNLIDEVQNRTLLPDLDMEITSYQLSGTGSDGSTFSESTSDSSITIDKLAFGDWSVTVQGLNAGGTLVGSGSGNTTVHSGETSTVDIIVTPLDGVGSLDLTINWTEGDVETPSVVSTLTPAAGTALDLAFGVSGNAATSNTNNINMGYHTLTVKLMDNGLLTMGAVEVVRIVKDQTTSGFFTFDKINQPGGSILVNISQKMADPLNVAINGASETKPENQSMSLSASVSDYSENVTWVWYVNGDSAETGNSFAFDDSYESGYYRIDLTGFSTDGTRAGSATTMVEVTEAAGISLNMISIISSSQAPVTCSLQGGTDNVILTRAFAISEAEITHAQFIEFLNDRGVAYDGSYNGETLIMNGPIRYNGSSFQFETEEVFYATTDNTPVVNVSWYGAVEFCNWLSEKEGKNPVYNTTDWSWDPLKDGYRLPSENEWEYAAQGGNGTDYTYAGSNTFDEVGWTGDNSESMIHPVKTKAPNGYGLYDMSGNAWEWCHDWYDDLKHRCMRGGSWSDAGFIAISHRSYYWPNYSGGPSFGFRIACTL